MLGEHWPQPAAALALACGLAAFGAPPALAREAPVVAAGSAPGSLTVSWQARDGAIDYDLRYHAGSADPADEADWIEEGEANGPPDPGAFTSETITGLAANTAYRVQVRAETVNGEGPWSASGSATTAAPPPPEIDRVQIVSWGSHDAAGNGRYDTYIRGDTILVDVVFTAPVEVGGDGNVVLRLDLGADDGDLDNSRRTATLQGARYGDTVLRFEYTVVAGDADADGVWVQTGAGDTVLFTPGSATVTGAAGGAAVDRTKSGLKTTGDPTAKVDGGRTSVPGPRPSRAAVNGDTLTVTFDENLDASVDTGGLIYDFFVRGAGGIDVAQSPRAVSISGATVTLTLSAAARPGEDAVTLQYGGTRLRDTSGNRAPSFRELAVTNNTPGAAAPTPVRGSAVGRTLRLVFDKALDESSAPPGDRFTVIGSDEQGHTVLKTQGTGTAAVSGKTLTVRLLEGLHGAERYRAIYTRPGDTAPSYVAYPEPGGNPLRGAASDHPEVASFLLYLETVHDGVAPALLGGEVSGGRVVLGFDEELDESSTPAAGDFAVTVAGADAVVSSVAVEGSNVVLTLNAAPAVGAEVGVSYTAGTNPIRDEAGNPSAAFQRTLTAVGSGKPALQSASVRLARLALTYDLPLDPGSVPAPGAFTLHRTLGKGETAADRREFRTGVVDVTVEGRTAVLRLGDGINDCEGSTPLTVTYAEPGASPLQGLDGTEVDGFEHLAVTNDRAPKCRHTPESEPAPPPLTASFEAVPETHDGRSLFRFELVFGEDFPGHLDYRTLRDAAFVVENGRVRRAERVVQGENRRWTITVRPDSVDDVTITLPAGSVSTQAGRALENTVSATVAGPAPAPPLTASFSGLPAEHDGRSLFRFELVFSENFPGHLDYRTLRDKAFVVEGGRVHDAERTVAGENRRWTITVRPDSGGDVTITLPAGSVSTDDGRSLAGTVSATVSGPVRAPLTASFRGLPAEHDGRKLFRFELVFSENFPGRLDYRTLRDEAFVVEGGRVRGAGRVVRSENRRWTITVRPDSGGDVTITLPAGSVSIEDGRRLENTVSATVSGPVGLSVADARVKEGPGAVLSFAVTLSRAAPSAFRVDYATADGTAQAGADYTAARGTLSFEAGDSSGTIEVAVLDDEHDEGEETLALRLSNPSSGALLDGEATGTIENRDLMPAALLARFGRAAAEQVVETVEERMAAPRERGFRARLAGRELRPGNEREFALGFLTRFSPGGAGADAAGGVRAANTTGMGGAVNRPRPGNGLPGAPAAGGDLLSSSGFELNRESRGGTLSVWSRSARSRFRGMEDALSLNGDVRTTMVGADWARGPLTLGLSVGHAHGLGGYAGVSGGQMATSLTGFYPWAGYRVNDRVSVWGVAGYGKGSLSLTPEGAEALKTGVSMAMAAVGTRGELLGSRAAGGFSLAFKADALRVGAASALLDGPGGRLNASEAGVTRVRTALEGSRGFRLGGGRMSLTPAVEVGLRRDGGDAETGAGMDLGGGIAFADAVTGMSLDVRVRTLVMHAAEGFSERGLSVSFGWDPAPSSPLGLSARLAPSWGGPAAGGAEALWSGQMAYTMGPHGMYGSGGQVNAEVGYGLPVGARFVGTPRVRLRTSPYGRDYGFGYGLGLLERGRLHFDLGIDAQRRESPMEGVVTSAFLARASLGW